MVVYFPCVYLLTSVACSINTSAALCSPSVSLLPSLSSSLSPLHCASELLSLSARAGKEE